MKKTLLSTAQKVAVALSLLSCALMPLSAISLDGVMNEALAHDSTLADSRSKLEIAKNNLFKSASLFGTNLSFSGSLSQKAATASSTGSSTAAGGSSGNSASSTSSSSANALKKSVSANLAIPLAKWLSLGVTGTTDASTTSGSVSLSLIPFAKVDTSAEAAWNKALVDAQSAIRNTLLSARKEYRAVLTAQTEVAWRQAVVQTSKNDLSRIQYLVELGKERSSKEITIYSTLISAQSDLDTAQTNLSTAIQNLSLRTGLAESALTDFDALTIVDGRTLVDENLWVESSADMVNAKANLDAAKQSKNSSTTLPDLSVGADVSNTLDWSVTAKVSFSPDLIFQKASSTASENLAMQERSYANTERSLRTAWLNQQNAVVKAQTNYENANRFVESSELSYTETDLQLQKGEASQADLDLANGNLLSAKYQLQKAIESLENARDQLDATWQVSMKP